jgi:hypothetical protein
MCAMVFPMTSPRMLCVCPSCRAGQAELNQQEVGRVHLVLLDGRPRRDGEHSLQVNRTQKTMCCGSALVLCCDLAWLKLLALY